MCITSNQEDYQIERLMLLAHRVVMIKHQFYMEYGGAEIRLKFKGDLLRQNKVRYNHGKIVNIYTVYEISSTFTSQSSFTLKNSLFGAV